MRLKQELIVIICGWWLVLMIGCRGAEPTTSTNSSQTTISPSPIAQTPFAALPQDAKVLQTRTLTSPTQKTYTIQTVEDDREAALRAEPANREAMAMSATAAGADRFRGTARKAAKLSLVNAPLENFADLPQLISSLVAENVMKNHRPPITTTATSNRVAEEKRNVRLKVFLYAASKEDDNDFHLILGRVPGSTPAVYLTMELSGLPANNSTAFAKLKAARDAFKTFFGAQLPGTSYDFYSPPIPVEVEGSLFFDMNHVAGGRPGPASLRSRMPVVWEVHPISKIVFEPE